jgi:hypothetical protein
MMQTQNRTSINRHKYGALKPKFSTHQILISKNMTNQNSESKKLSMAAVNGILKRGNAYKFTHYKHEEIIAYLEDVRINSGFSNKKFSIALGYGDTAYQSWKAGARFSGASYDKVMQKAREIKGQQNGQKQLSFEIEGPIIMTDMQMGLHLKSRGWIVKRPITTITYEEI